MLKSKICSLCFVYDNIEKLPLLLCIISALTCVLSMKKHVTEEEFEHVYGRVDPRCPLTDIAMSPVHLQHAYNCKKFYKCYMGRAYLMDCPAGTEWNPILDNCNEKRGLCRTAQIAVANDPQCPAVDDPHNPVHYPHPFECNFFFKCANGAGVLFECPPGLHFSVITDRCERPEDAKCQVN